MSGETYKVVSVIHGLIIFVAAWLYCIANYGFLLGVGLGWLPAFITAVILCWLWPLFWIAVVGTVAIGGAVLLKS